MNRFKLNTRIIYNIIDTGFGTEVEKKMVNKKSCRRSIFIIHLLRNYLKIHFFTETIDELFTNADANDKGVYVDRDIWRKKEVIVSNATLLVAAVGAGKYYSVDFSSENIEKRQIKAKSETFYGLTKELLAYSRENLK